MALSTVLIGRVKPRRQEKSLSISDPVGWASVSTCYATHCQALPPTIAFFMLAELLRLFYWGSPASLFMYKLAGPQLGLRWRRSDRR